MEEVKENAMTEEVKTDSVEVRSEEVQAGGEAQPEKHKKIRIIPLIAFTANIFYLVVQVVIAVMFFAGAAPLFGEGFTIVSCINYLIDIFSVNLATAYTCICGCIFTIIYIVFIAMIIKLLCSSVKKLINLVKITFAKNKEENANLPPFYTLNIYYPCVKTFFYLVCFTGLSNLVSYNTLSGSMITCMVLVGICSVANAVIPLLANFSKEKIAPLVLNVSREILGFTVVCLLFVFANQTVAKDFINGVVMLFNGSVISEGSDAKAVIYMIYGNIVSPVLFIILASLVLKVISGYFSNPVERKITASIISLLIYSVVYMILHLVFKIILVEGTFNAGMIGDWINILKANLLPIFILLVTLLVIEIPFRKN